MKEAVLGLAWVAEVCCEALAAITHLRMSSWSWKAVCFAIVVLKSFSSTGQAPTP